MRKDIKYCEANKSGRGQPFKGANVVLYGVFREGHSEGFLL